ncbi:tyrosine aminotransferase [Phlebotomus argentipes]|uniref:tyrosine aminotransferase n=1 Tax=Phlebotomus argentipes TaxID=94469 RepID=UPI0028935D54|nr:tyrosine aminotransferase [Phlebotomus argentipes]
METDHINNNNNGQFVKKLTKSALSQRTKWNLKSTSFAESTVNPIRAIVEGLKFTPNPEKQLIPLSIGDPTTFGNLQPCHEIVEPVVEMLRLNQCNGYGPSTGRVEARQAVAEYEARQNSVGPLTADDIVLCSGCSSALELCIAALAEQGQNILIPRPGFSIYQTLAPGFGVSLRMYNLLPDRGWEIDLLHLESLIDENTAAVVVLNPSNPCGSNFSKSHLQQIIKLCEKYYLPIIADEIYEHMVFPGKVFHSVSSLSKNVPVLSCGGLTKRFLVPGWRMGWITIHDRHNLLKDVRVSLMKLSARILGPNAIVQGALPRILTETPQSFFDETVAILQKHATIAFEILSEVRGLKPIMPDGAMYMMISIDVENFPEYPTDLHFVKALVEDQSVFCLPGQCFEYPNYVRIVLTVPEDLLREACFRIAEFCDKHFKIDERIIQNAIIDTVN